MNFAHSSSPKSVLEWVLLAEQIQSVILIKKD